MGHTDGPPQSVRPAGADSAPVLPSPVLSVRTLTKRFPGVVANDGISLDFHAGETHVLLGENGAGKSTLIGMLAGMLRPDAGEILVQGSPVRILTPRQSLDLGIGTVFQHMLLVPSLSVIENLMLGGPWWQRLARGAAYRRFAELSECLGISLDPDLPVGHLSLGQQQQVEILRALWRDTRVLILDEPTSMLTPQGVRDLSAVLCRLCSQGVAIVLVTHKLAEAYDLGDRVSVLRQGRLVGGIAADEHRGMTEAQMTDQVIAMMFDPAHAPMADERAILLGRGNVHAPSVRRGAAPCLEVRNISTMPRTAAHGLQGVSFDLRPGEVLGIAGVDGNGQKQLAEVIAGQRAPSSGTVLVGGKDVTQGDVAARRNAGIRYVTDDRLGEGTVGSLSVAINLLLKNVGAEPFWHRGIADWARIRQAARDDIQRHDIRTRSEQTLLAKLSGGNIQKVLLARELGKAEGDVKVIVFSKPTHGLDLHNAQLAHRRIRESAAAGRGIVLLSTDLDELLTLSDRIGVLFQGRLVGIVDNGPGAGAAIGRLMTGAVAA
ncbi:MAG: ABC transporter ATP-binding protein [Proteobacteria bacterium]|nr:ABC transporter ATP-binding protein [Pseudomonadota bacterium]